MTVMETLGTAAFPAAGNNTSNNASPATAASAARHGGAGGSPTSAVTGNAAAQSHQSQQQMSPPQPGPAVNGSAMASGGSNGPSNVGAVSLPPPGLAPVPAAGSGAAVPMVAKSREEILTSLHLIKDIRRLETYQRDFFLKVKESLNHVQLLLDHQLMDMAWSDNLIDCEESLLKASAHLGSSTPAQVSELYALLIQDREKLNHRFQELSVKSSLSEYVVNSRTLLDVDMVHVATEAILRNEKPAQPKPDKIPVDHTFFLANFCTTSIASSMFASFMPKREGYRGFNDNGNGKQAAGSGGAANNSTVTTISSHHAASAGGTGQNAAGAGMEKANMKGGMAVQPQQQQQQSQQPQQQHKGSQQQQQHAEKVNFYGRGGNELGGAGNSGGGLYNGNDVMGRGASAKSTSGGNGAPVAGQDNSDLQKGGVFTGHELVAAISQITRRPEETSPTKPQQQQQQAGKKGGDPWAKEDGEMRSAEDDAGATPTGGGRRSQQQGGAAAGANFVGHNGYGGGGANSQSSPHGPNGEQGQQQHQQQAQQQPDASTDSVNSESDDGRPSAAAAATAAAVAAYNSLDFDNKPLSFARIASLNLEKAANAGVPGVGAVRMGAAAGGGGGGPSGNPGSLGMTNLGGSKLGGSQSLTANMTTLPPPLSMGGGMGHGGQQALGGGGLDRGPSTALSNVPGLAGGGGGPSGPQGGAGVAMPLIPLPPSNNPRYFFDIAMEGKRLGRVIIEVQPAVSPKMSQNFGMLVVGERGFGYKGCHFFQAWKNESVICGDWEHNSGRGGRAALEGGPLFTPDETRLPCIRGAVGMRRMSKKHSSLNQVASQFRIILANMNTQFTGIFGHVVSGIEALDKVANIGGEGGRPEKIASVVNCGVYKS